MGSLDNLLPWVEKRGRLVYSTAVDSSGAVIGPKANQTQKVLVDFRRSIGINLVPTRWGEAWIFQQFE